MKTIAICSGKGGSGKTFSTLSIAVQMVITYSRANILLIDLDPSTNSSKIKLNGGLTGIIGAGRGTKSISDLFQDARLNPMDVVCEANEDFPGISLIPSDESLEYIDRLIAKRHNTDLILRNALQKIDNNFDFCLLDCPPNRGTLTANAIAACDGYITPLDLDINSIDGVLAMRRLVDDLLDEGVIKSSPTDLGAFWTRYTSQKSHAKKMITKFAEDVIKNHLLDVRIPESTHVKEAIYSSTTLQYDPKHRVSKAYKHLTQHITSHL